MDHINHETRLSLIILLLELDYKNEKRKMKRYIKNGKGYIEAKCKSEYIKDLIKRIKVNT